MGAQPQTYLARFFSPTTAVSEVGGSSGLSLAQAVPTPCPSLGRIRFTLPSSGPVTLRVYDLRGREVSAPLESAERPAGPHEIEIRTEQWPVGCYFYRLEFGAATVTRKLLVIR